MKALLLASLLLCSCVQDSYVAINGNKSLTHKRMQFGGTTSFTRGDGSSEANDYQVSARDFFSTVGTVAGSLAYGSVTKANNAASALTTQQANKQAAALAAQKQADATAIEILKLTPSP